MIITMIINNNIIMMLNKKMTRQLLQLENWSSLECLGRSLSCGSPVHGLIIIIIMIVMMMNMALIMIMMSKITLVMVMVRTYLIFHILLLLLSICSLFYEYDHNVIDDHVHVDNGQDNVVDDQN